ncbi:uncharacterized protein LOC142606093 [Castanea sativa]|uniref:uncharacterized protein LOC142606093 n=1 Tax=Castanea sativa TaxID=21020 RepID=UPI003F6493E0
MPWLYARDFNEVAKQSEKMGGRARHHAQMQAFQDILDECGFMDLGFVGPMCTWHKHFKDYTIWERLDRSVETSDWFFMFPNTKVYHLDVTTSNHKPLWIMLEGMECKQQWPFKFEKMWMIKRGCGDTIEVVWKENYEVSGEQKMLKKVNNCGKKLATWSKNSFGNVRRELEKKKEVIGKGRTVSSQWG